MAAPQDTSVLFSLNQIMNAHESRLRDEQEAIARREEAERKAREDSARREASERAARAREEAEQKAREEAQRRAEEARLEAMRLAAVERARIEAETQARIEMMQKAAEHERALEAMRADAQKKRLERSVMTSLAGAVALFGVATGVYFGKLAPEAEAQIIEQSARIAAIQEESGKLRTKVDENERRIEQAAKDVEEAAKKLDGKEIPKPSATGTASSIRTPAPRVPLHGKPAEVKQGGGQCLPGEPGCDLNGNRIF
jgi:multidrug efflux pump subunit AcrA (membrane-fusion protein)